MKLELVRYGLGDESTLGKLYIDGEFACFTLEDERRKVKVPGETCIPEGAYKLTLRTEGGFHQRYAKLYPGVHRGMLWIRNVPGFEYILIHQGNATRDTAGCLLLGARALVGLDGEFSVQHSAIAYKHIYPLVADAIEKGEGATITVRSAA